MCVYVYVCRFVNQLVCAYMWVLVYVYTCEGMCMYVLYDGDLVWVWASVYYVLV